MNILPDTRSKAYMARGRGHLRLREYETAESDFDQALTSVSETTLIKHQVSESYRAFGYKMKSENPKMAIRAFNQALELKPYEYTIYSARAEVYFMIGAYPQAIADATQGIMFEPENAKVYYWRGCAYKETGEHRQAIADFSRVIELKPGMPDIHFQRGLLYASLEDSQQAISDFSRVIDLAPGFPEAYLQRGLLCYNLVYNDESRMDDARRAYADLPKFKEMAPPGRLNEEMEEQLDRMILWLRVLLLTKGGI